MAYQGSSSSESSEDEGQQQRTASADASQHPLPTTAAPYGLQSAFNAPYSTSQAPLPLHTPSTLGLPLEDSRVTIPGQSHSILEHGTMAPLFESSKHAEEQAHRAPAHQQRESSRHIRRRITRACDQCNKLRARCDGHDPCGPCKETGRQCQYLRPKKKRGKTSQRERAAEGTPASTSRRQASGYALTHLPTGSAPMEAHWSNIHGGATIGGLNPHALESSGLFTSAAGPADYTTSSPPLTTSHLTSRAHSLGLHTDSEHIEHLQPLSSISRGRRRADSLRGSPATVPIHGYPFETDLPDYSAAASPIGGSPSGIHERNFARTPRSFSAGSHTSEYPEISPQYLSAYSQPPTALSVHSTDNESLRSGANSPSDRSSWLTRAQTPLGHFRTLPAAQPSCYPVLNAVVPELMNLNIMPATACDLLKHYFDHSSLTGADFYTPRSPGRVFRRRSVLHPSHPRPCTSALLVSMLWTAARTSPSPFFDSLQTRNEVCRRLFILAKRLIQQADNSLGVEAATWSYGRQPQGTSTGGSYLSQPIGSNNQGRHTLDDVATFYHLAAASTFHEPGPDGSHWWNAAFSAARELGLGREPGPQLQSASLRGNAGGSTSRRRADSSVEASSGSPASSQRHGRTSASHEPLSDEQREERRRMWWLLYVTDRHLSLHDPTYGSFLDQSMSMGLAGPVDEAIWQSENDYTDPPGNSTTRSSALL